MEDIKQLHIQKKLVEQFITESRRIDRCTTTTLYHMLHGGYYGDLLSHPLFFEKWASSVFNTKRTEFTLKYPDVIPVRYMGQVFAGFIPPQGRRRFGDCSLRLFGFCDSIVRDGESTIIEIHDPYRRVALETDLQLSAVKCEDVINELVLIEIDMTTSDGEVEIDVTGIEKATLL